MTESQKLIDIKKRIDSNEDNDVNNYVQFLTDYPEETEKFSEFLYDSSKRNYEINRKKKKIFKQIMLSLPSSLENILNPFFNIPNNLIIKNDYFYDDYILLVKEVFEQNYSYELLSQVLNKIVKAPYNIITKLFIIDFPELREHYEKLNPEIYKLFDDQIKRLKEEIDQYKKNIYVPKVQCFDSTNPRISKFGGVAPYLPSNGPKTCPCGEGKLQTVFSLYIPSIPEEMRKLFPSDHEYVVVGYTCNTCYSELQVELYKDEEIDQLVYDDVPGFDEVFNEPRVVVEWIKSQMTPNGTYDSGFEIPNKEKFSEEDLFFIEQFLTKRSENFYRTYLGGYPIFVQGDDSPPDHELLLEMEESEASTNMWGDCGTCQVWMTTGKDFGNFVMQYACC